jgi:hypothetical protein
MAKKRTYRRIDVKMPEYDCDVMLNFPSGKRVMIQSRPSNADVNYNGSLDVCLPDNQVVTNWIGDSMEAAPKWSRGGAHERLAKQLVMEIP